MDVEVSHFGQVQQRSPELTVWTEPSPLPPVGPPAFHQDPLCLGRKATTDREPFHQKNRFTVEKTSVDSIL